MCNLTNEEGAALQEVFDGDAEAQEEIKPTGCGMMCPLALLSSIKPLSDDEMLQYMNEQGSQQPIEPSNQQLDDKLMLIQGEINEALIAIQDIAVALTQQNAILQQIAERVSLRCSQTSS